MPIYEYHCNNCQQKVSVFRRDYSVSANCPSCGSSDITRLVSTFIPRMKESFDDVMGDNKLVDGMMRNDWGAVGEWNKRMIRVFDDRMDREDEVYADYMMKTGSIHPDLAQEINDYSGSPPAPAEEELYE